MWAGDIDSCKHVILVLIKMIYSHNFIRPEKLPIVCFLFSKTCPNITANSADSILAMVTDALASFYVIAPLIMDGRSSIFISKSGNTQEHLCQLTCLQKRKSFKKNFRYRQETESLIDRKPYNSGVNLKP